MRQKIEIIFNSDVQVDFCYFCQILVIKFGITFMHIPELGNKTFTNFESKEKIEKVVQYVEKLKGFDSYGTIKVIDEGPTNPIRYF